MKKLLDVIRLLGRFKEFKMLDVDSIIAFVNLSKHDSYYFDDYDNLFQFLYGLIKDFDLDFYTFEYDSDIKRLSFIINLK